MAETTEPSDLDAQSKLMEAHGITFDGTSYHYREWRYKRLEDAVNYAKLEEERANKKVASSREASRKTDILQEITTIDLSLLRNICSQYSGGAGANEYFVEPIPDRKENDARDGLMIPASEHIVALIDFTVIGDASNAMVVTDHGFHWKNKSDNFPHHLSWSQFLNHTLSEIETTLSKSIDFGNGLEIVLQGETTLCQKDNHRVFQLLTHLKAMLETLAADPQTSVIPDRVENGLVECEFCKGKVKPQVTYCKHCGIKLRG